jgi:outer membrane protein TolC
VGVGVVVPPVWLVGLIWAYIPPRSGPGAAVVYGQVASQAFKDVEVALTNERSLRDQETQTSSALRDTQNALNFSIVKYKIDQTDLSPILQMQYMVVGTQMESASVQYDLIANRINLFLALGGAI